ncbi:hypothetical protein E4T51_12085 [Aureobasidium sp. EXF-12344]|nr:hypothetical protein E4T51_12085 [Aureobasidium sp. EXF-12344]
MVVCKSIQPSLLKSPFSPQSIRLSRSLNQLVSTFGVIFKLTLLMAVSAALAQGKWTWFQKRADTLSTFEAIDAGSRGTVGSLKLLLRMRGQHLVSAGALVITLGFMIQPFLQSAISEHGRLIKMDTSNTNGTSAVIGRSRKLDTGTQCVQSIEANYPKIDTTPDFAISASLYDGLNAALGRGYPNVSFTCISGNCTWPEYVSIAVRSTCFDISDHLERASSSAVNDSMDSSKPETGVVMYPTAPPSASSDVRDQPSTADWDAADASAMECGLELALNVYNSSVVNNVLLEQVVASVSRKVPKSWLPSRVDQSGVLPNGSVGDPGTLESNPIYHDIFMYRDDYALDPSPLQMKNASNFTMTQKTLLSTVDFLTSLIRQDNDNGTVKAVPQANKSILYTYGSAILQPLLNQTNTTAAFDAIAKTVASETVAKLKSVTPGGPEGFALTAADQPMTRISRPTTPMRDEEEHEMDVLKVAAKSQTRDSAVTLVDPQSFRGAAAGNVRPVSPVSAGPGWSDVPIDDASTPLEIRTST